MFLKYTKHMLRDRKFDFWIETSEAVIGEWQWGFKIERWGIYTDLERVKIRHGVRERDGHLPIRVWTWQLASVATTNIPDGSLSHSLLVDVLCSLALSSLLCLYAYVGSCLIKLRAALWLLFMPAVNHTHTPTCTQLINTHGLTLNTCTHCTWRTKERKVGCFTINNSVLSHVCLDCDSG